MLTNNFLADKFPIEAEVMAEVCSAQNSEYAPQDCLSLTDATQVRMEAQEPVGCVLYYEIAPYRGVCGATVGADGGGEFADVFLGDPEACATAAREKVLEMERRGTKLKNASILCNGDIYSYSGSHVTVTSLAPQPPAPCPKCAESERIEALATAKLGDEIIKNGSLQDKLAQLKCDFALEHDDKLELQAKVAEQTTEIEWLTACLSKANAQTEHFEREWYLRGDAIEHQAERIAELESLRGQDAKAYERLDELRNRDADKMAEQAALIEKCEKALIEARDDVYSELIRAKQSAGYKRYDDEIKRQMAQLVRHDEAIAAIAAQKGGV